MAAERNCHIVSDKPIQAYAKKKLSCYFELKFEAEKASFARSTITRSLVVNFPVLNAQKL